MIVNDAKVDDHSEINGAASDDKNLQEDKIIAATALLTQRQADDNDDMDSSRKNMLGIGDSVACEVNPASDSARKLNEDKQSENSSDHIFQEIDAGEPDLSPTGDSQNFKYQMSFKYQKKQSGNQSQGESMKNLSRAERKRLIFLNENSASFCIKDKKFHYAKRSCFCLDQDNQFRWLCAYIMANPWFDRFITLCILINSLLLASKEFEKNYDPNYHSTWNETLEKIDIVFTVIFLLECIIKIVAMGFLKSIDNKNKINDINFQSSQGQQLEHDSPEYLEKDIQCYSSDGWNWIDFFIVTISVVSLTPWANQEGLKAFRTARVLRPLRSVQTMKSMRMLIQTFLMSIPGLFNVCIALSFVFLIFAIFGVNFFVGTQYQFCRSAPELVFIDGDVPYWPISEDADYLCNSDEMCVGYPNNLGKGAVCGNVYDDYDKLQPKDVDKTNEMEKIFYDITNFNNIFTATITVFSVITLEGWSSLMYNYQDQVSSLAAAIFFIMVVFLGSFITINLVLASLMHQFLIQQEKQNQESIASKQVVQEKIQVKKQQVKSDSVQAGTIVQSQIELQPISSANTNVSNQRKEKKNLEMSVIQSRGEGAYQSQLSQLEDNEDIPDKSVGGGGQPYNFDEEKSSIEPLNKDQTLQRHQSLIDEVEDLDRSALPSMHGQTMQRFNAAKEFKRDEEEQDEDFIKRQSSQKQQFSERQSPRSLQNESIMAGLKSAVTSEKISFGGSELNDESQQVALILQNQLKEQSQPISAASSSMVTQNQAELQFLHLALNNNANAQAEQAFPSNEGEYETDVVQRSKRNKCYSFCYQIVISVTFNFLIYCLILANTITLALYRYDQSKQQESVLQQLDIFFVWVFTAEMIIKLIGLGLKNYLLDRFNIFDAIIVILSLVDFSINVAGVIPEDDENSGIFSAFRAMRILRVIKLARKWKAFKNILEKVIISLGEIGYFSILLLIFMFILALLGMEMFAYSVAYDIDEEEILGKENVQQAFLDGKELTWPRDSFNNVFRSMVTIFIMIVGEDWNQVMYKYVRASSIDSDAGRYIAIVYFIFVMILGNVILLALFTALLLKNFEPSNFQKDEDSNLIEDKRQLELSALRQSTIRGAQDQEFKCKHICSKQCLLKVSRKFSDSFIAIFGGQEALQRREKTKKKDPKVSASPMSGNAVSKFPPNIASIDAMIAEQIVNQSEEIKQEAQVVKKLQRPLALLHYDYDQISRFTEKQKNPKKEQVEIVGKSLNLFGPENVIRKVCTAITNHKLFDNVIIVLIIISTFTLALEEPLQDPNSQKMENIKILDIIMTMIFTIEAMLKIIALGFLFNKQHSYLRSSWNILDFLIVTFALISTAIQTDISFIKVLRVARILRPLRLIQRAQGLKLAIRSLFKAIPDIMRLQTVVFFVMFMISILFTSLLSGKMFSCDLQHTTLSVPQQSKNVDTKWDCINYGGEWKSPVMNFDDTLSGMVTLFIFQSKEGWIDVMWQAVDAKGVDQQPQIGYSEIYTVIFMMLVVLLCLLFVNMFVGVVIDTYNTQKEKISFNKLLNETERSWLRVQIMTYHMKPVAEIRPHEKFSLRNICIKITINKYFDNFIMFCIVINTCVLAMKWFDEPDYMPKVTEIANYVFMVIFTLEAVMKIIAMKSLYFKDSWNIFDFVIVALTLAILSLKLMSLDFGIDSTTSVLRCLRIGRILRLIRKLKSLQIILMTLVDSAPSLGSLLVLIILLFFMFAIIGRSLFSFAPISREGMELNEHANFRDFWTSFLLLMRCSTGESWHLIMFDLSRGYSETNQCNQDESYETMIENNGDTFACGSPIVSHLYFIMFHILVSQIFMNLFVAVIIDAFISQSDQFDLPIQAYSLFDFVQIWATFDPEATGFIRITDLENFIIALAKQEEGSKLVIFKDLILNDPVLRRRFIRKLNIPTYYQLKCVNFTDTLQQLCDKVNLLNFREVSDEADSKKEFDYEKYKDQKIVTLDELEAIMISIGQNPTKAELQDMLNEFDDIGKRRLDYPKFCALVLRQMRDADIKEQLSEAFAVFDRDGGGTISIDELQVVMNNLGLEISEEELNQMIRAADSDGDSSMNYEEFQRMMTPKVSQSVEEQEHETVLQLLDNRQRHRVFNEIMKDKSDAKDFDQLIRQIGQLSPKIELMLNLQSSAKKLHDNVSVYADTESNMNISHQDRKATKLDELKDINRKNISSSDGAEDIYLMTTKHYYNGILMYNKLIERRTQNQEFVRAVLKDKVQQETQPQTSFGLLGQDGGQQQSIEILNKVEQIDKKSQQLVNSESNLLSNILQSHDVSNNHQQSNASINSKIIQDEIHRAHVAQQEEGKEQTSSTVEVQPEK